ncbi:MAG: Rab family GTPase [Thermoplasmata archaeon]
MQATASEDPRVKLKVCLAGDVAVGKTSLVRRFVCDEFDDRYLSTLGAKMMKKEIQAEMPGSRRQGHVDLIIWDIMGYRGFQELLKEAYFRGSQGILAVCDVTRPETLVGLEDWRRAIEKVAGGLPSYVLANKVDLTEEAQLWGEDLEAFCEGWGGSPYLLTSAKTGENVEEAFEGLTSLVLEAQLRRRAEPA